MIRRLRALFALAGLDALVQPAVPVVAARAGAATTELHGREQSLDALHPRFTALASLTGSPALSVPCGLDAAGLAVGLELVGPALSEATLFRLGALVEVTAGARRVAAQRRRAVRSLHDAATTDAR
jgi:aspartyl-tRNA(Asn)/glutamyl-tRNA(Gln) amidotransferase subunit A